MNKTLKILNESFDKKYVKEELDVDVNADLGNLVERIDLARNPNTPSNILLNLANDSDEDVRFLVAKHPNTPPDALELLAKNLHYNSYDIRWYVAKHPNTPPEALELLAKDCDKYIRQEVAKNLNTPPEALELLAKDPDEYVHFLVAANPNTPPEVLELLANDEYEDIRKIAVNRIPYEANQDEFGFTDDDFDDY